MISNGDSIIMIDECGHRHPARAGAGTLETEFGNIDLSVVLGKDPGTAIKSDLNRDFIVIFEPVRKICFFGRSCCDT